MIHRQLETPSSTTTLTRVFSNGNKYEPATKDRRI